MIIVVGRGGVELFDNAFGELEVCGMIVCENGVGCSYS
jgi:hypothetical protein